MHPINPDSGKIIRMSVSSDCPICLDPFQPNEERVLSHPPQLQNGRLVTHEFHDECLTAWIQNCRDSGKPIFCPLCRSSSPEPQQNIPNSLSNAAPQRQGAPSLANRIHAILPSAPSFVSEQRQPAPYRMLELPPLDSPPHGISSQRGGMGEFPLLTLNVIYQQVREISRSASSLAAPAQVVPNPSFLQHPLQMSPAPLSAHFANHGFSSAAISYSFSSRSSNVAISQSSSSSSSSNQVGMRINESQQSEETPADKYYSLAIRLLNQGDRSGAIGQFIQVANARYYFKNYDPEIACFTTHYELAKHFRDDLKDLQKAQLHFSKTIEFRSGCKNPNQLAEARLFMAERYSTGSGRIKKNVDKALKLLHQIISEPYGVGDDLIQAAKAHFKLYASGIDYSPEAYRQLVKSKKRTSLEALGDNGGNPPKRPREG